MFDYFAALLRTEQNFALARYGDGEAALIQGTAIGPGTQATDIDGWSCPEGITPLGAALRKSLNHYESNYFYGIPQPSHRLGSFYKVHKSCDANIWVNENWERARQLFLGLTNVVLVSRAPIEGFEHIPVLGNVVEIPVPQIHPDHGKTYLFALGPLSCVLIDEMYRREPRNRYVDIGSALDIEIHKRVTRPYMEGRW